MHVRVIGWALVVALAGCDAEEDPGPAADEDDPGCVRAQALELDGCPELLGKSHCSEGREHVPVLSPIDYAADPPHSGPHDPSATYWGLHQSAVDRGTYVHNLEHGGIALAYDCTDCDDELRVFADVVAERPDMRILVTRDVELPSRFAAISWTWSWTFERVDADALMCFIDQHEGFAPENIAK